MVAILLLLILLNGYFVAAEFALVRLHAAPAHRFQTGDGLRERTVRAMLHNVDAYLSTAQLGITLTSLAIGALGEPYVAKLLAALLGGILPADVELSRGVAFAISITFITLVTIIVGEQGPKSYGIKAYETVMGLTAVPLRAVYVATYPLVWLIHRGSLAIVRILGETPGHARVALSEEELALLLMQSRTGGSISERERRIMVNAMQLEELAAREIMVPRPEVVTIAAGATVAMARQLVLRTGHSRVPAVDPDLDHCLGIIYAKDLLDDRLDANSPVGRLAREAPFVPETVSAERLLVLFQSRGLHMAVTVDEFGGASGVVTLENVLEAMVGDIKDEYDVAAVETVRVLADGRYRAEGRTRLDELRDRLGCGFETDQETLSGWFIDAFDGFPKRGDTLDHAGHRFTVEAVERHRITSLLIERLAPVDAAAPATA